MNIKYIMVLILTILATILATLNIQMVNVNLLLGKINLPLIVLIVILLGVGFAAGYLVKSIRIRHVTKNSD